MERVLKGIPEIERPVPDGVVSAPISVLAPGVSDPSLTGELRYVPEYFYRENVPEEEKSQGDLSPLDQLLPPPS